MKLSNNSIEKLLKIMPEYWKKECLNLNIKKLCKIFNDVGFKDVYTPQYTVIIENEEYYRPGYFKLRLKDLNGTSKLEHVFESLADTRYYDNDKINDIDTFVNEINEIIKYDNYKLNKNSNSIYKIECIKTDK